MDGITKSKDDEPNEFDTITSIEVSYFDKHGRDTKEQEACAKVVSERESIKRRNRFVFAKSNQRFFALVGHDEQLYNPLDELPKHTGKVKYRFKEVKFDIYDKYIHFLRTKNQASLRIANRSLNDA